MVPLHRLSPRFSGHLVFGEPMKSEVFPQTVQRDTGVLFIVVIIFYLHFCCMKLGVYFDNCTYDRGGGSYGGGDNCGNPG